MASRPDKPRRRLPAWLLVAWIPVISGHISLQTTRMARDGLEWGRMAVVVAAAVLLGLVLRELRDSYRLRRSPRTQP